MNYFESLKITAWLQCGVVCEANDAYLPIDAILYYMVYRDAYGPQDMTMPGGDSSGIGQAYMPLARRGLTYDAWYADGTPIWQGQEREFRAPASDDQWYYAASFAQWEQPYTDGIDHWNKRFDQHHSDLIDFRGKRGNVIIEKGRYKSFHTPIFYRHARSVSWFVVGDGGVIAQLLAHVTHIGTKTSQGWGSVLRWEVESWPRDWSVYGERDQLMRAVPAETGILTGLRPSYWMRKNQAICQVPS